MTCARRTAGAHNPASSTAAASARPDPRSGRRRARLLPALALLLGALFPFAAAPAAAAVLVSNIGKAEGNKGNIGPGWFEHAQPFTTGTSAGGYTAQQPAGTLCP